VIPKRWRYLEKLPVDAQGKKKKEAVAALFKNAAIADAASTSAFNELDAEKIIERTENSVILEFSIPGTSQYYDGHFPGFPILPAVAQAEIIIRFAARYLGTNIDPIELKRVKFTSLIKPYTPLYLKLTKNDKAISFVMCSPDGKTTYSTGTVVQGSK